ncbi:MAG: alpha/beta hydrolase, partial [Christiangramia sp.]|nr:alpha/beta hydrolase [Christiangramia sp.]
FHARHLARKGIASFTYDKRGSGKSGGETYEVGYSGYADDAIAAIKKIKSQNNFDRVGLFAVSEGEWVSLIVDSKEKIDFILMVSASGSSPFQQTLRELTYRLERKNFKDQDIEEAKGLYREILAFDNDSLKRKQIEERIMRSRDKAWFEAGEDFSDELYYYPWWHKIMNFNPKEYLEKTDTDILVLIGNDNQSYPPAETISNFKRYENVKVVKFDKGDHSLLEWKLGKGVPPPFFVKGYLKTYAHWIGNNCNKD